VGVRRSSNGIADALVVLRLSKDGGVEVVYNGAYARPHGASRDKPDTSNGQVVDEVLTTPYFERNGARRGARALSLTNRRSRLMWTRD